ncbi:hypothetical protein Tco_1253560 [Tanacetum coccineum]
MELHDVSYGIEYVARPLLHFFSSENRLLWFRYREYDLAHLKLVFEFSIYKARIRRIFLDGYGVLVFRIVIFKISSFKLLNARLLLTDFVVFDYDVDPRVPLILGRPFLRTARALVDVFKEELILRDGDEKLIFYADNTSKHPQKHENESIIMINFIDITYEDRFPELLKKSTHPLSGGTTPLSNSLPSLKPFETSDSLVEEFADELALLDLFPPGIGDADFDSEGDILLLDKLLNDDLSSPLPSKELNFEELKMIKSSIDDSPPLDVLGGNSVTLSNPLSDSNDDFTSSDDELLPEEDVPKENFKIYSNPLFKFDEEYISSGINFLFNEVLEDIENKDSYVSNLVEPALLVTPLSDANEDECFDPGGYIDEIDAFLDIDVSTDIEDGYYDSEGDVIYLKCLLINDTTHNLPPKVFLDHNPKSLKDERLRKLIVPDYEDSSARGFVHRSLRASIIRMLIYGNPIS